MTEKCPGNYSYTLQLYGGGAIVLAKIYIHSIANDGMRNDGSIDANKFINLFCCTKRYSIGEETILFTDSRHSVK